MFFLIIIKLLLEYLYVYFVAQIFSYSGFRYDFNFSNYVLGWVVYLIGYFLLLQKSKIYIFEVYHILFFIYILPTIIYYSLSNQGTIEFLALIIPYFFIVGFTFEKFKIKIKVLPKGKLIVILLSFFLISLVLFNYLNTTGGQIVLNFQEVYGFRDEFGAKSTNGIFGYLNSWVMKIFSVLLLGWAIVNKNRLIIILSITTLFFLFALSGHKGILKGFVIIYFFKFLLRRENRREFILISYLLLLVTVSFFFVLFDSQFLGSLLIRRLFFVPVFLNFNYIEFFSSNDLIYWSNGILSSLIKYPYSLQPTYLIGEFVGSSDMSANTGFLANGYMHLGYLGILFYTLLSVLIFNIINTLGKRIDKFLVMAITFLPIHSLFMGSDLFTTLLTHGLMVAIIILYLFENKDYYLVYGSKKIRL